MESVRPDVAARDVLTTKEAAALLRLHSQTLFRLRQTNAGPPHFRVGTKVLYLRDDVLRWARDRREGGGRD